MIKAKKFFWDKEKWYHIEAIIDEADNTFDIIIDGVKLIDLITLQALKKDPEVIKN